MTLNLDKSTWKRVAFGDVIESVTDRVDDPSAAGVDRYVGLEHLDPGVMTVQRWDTPDKVAAQKLRFHPGDVIFGRRRAYQKKVARADFEGICSAHALVLRARPEFVEPDFLPVFLASDYFLDRAIEISVGSLSPTVNWRDLKVQEFDLPSLDEQKRIANVLWGIERHRQSVDSALEHLARSRSQWFEKALIAGARSHGWVKKPVQALVESGPTNGKSARANDEQRGVPTLSISAIREGRVVGDSSVKYIDVDASEVARFVIVDDDFFIVRGNGNKQLTGRAGVAKGGLPEGCVYPDLLIRLRFDPDVIRTDFAVEQWNSAAAHGELIQRAKSTNGIWKINGKDIKAHQLVVPPLDAQRDLLMQLSVFEASVRAARSEYLSLNALRVSISCDLFGGR